MSKKSSMIPARSDSPAEPQDGHARSPSTDITSSEHQPAPPSEPLTVHEDSAPAKRSRGRPRRQKNAAEFDANGSAQPVFVALGLADEPVEKRSRGRPKKYLSDDSPISAPPLQQVSTKKRGRPAGSGKKTPIGEIQNQSALVPVSSSGNIETPRRGRGRPKGSRNSGTKKSSGRPVGRPRNVSSLSGELPFPTYEDMKRKLEYMQTKILQATTILKPEFGRQSSALAIAAIQELENLAELDLTGPFQELPASTPAPAAES